MTQSHKLMLGVSNLTEDNELLAVAIATKYLLREISDLQIIQEVSPNYRKLDWYVTFMVRLSDSQLEEVRDSDSLTHLGQV